MTTVTPFQPPLGSVFSFQPTLDGQQYLVFVKWGLCGQRWYAECDQLDGTLVFYVPLIGSPTGVAIETLSWLQSSVTATTAAPHGYQIGTVVTLTIAGASPAAYNGIYECAITGSDTFTYDVTDDPGAATVNGVANYDINLAAGYFTASTLVFRDQSQAFEVSP